MRIDVAQFTQQQARARQLGDEFIAYAQSIGCTVIQDEIITDERQGQLLTKWWQAKTDGRW